MLCCGSAFEVQRAGTRPAPNKIKNKTSGSILRARRATADAMRRWRTAKRGSSMHRTAARRAFPPTRCLQCAVAASLGRYAAPGKHVLSAVPQPAASTSALKSLALAVTRALHGLKGYKGRALVAGARGGSGVGYALSGCTDAT
jgi:hypothetical protein